MQNGLPGLTGVGVGLRSCHYNYIESEHPEINWFEVLTDNYLCDGGPGLDHLDKIRARYSITLHGVGMSLGSTDPLNKEYLKKLKKLIKHTEPLSVSDHLCWTSLGGNYFHELLPLPFTEEAVTHVAHRIAQVQDYLQQQILIENVSSYLSCNYSTLTEWDFIQAIAEEANCLILLDINNVYVSGHNNQFDPAHYLTHLTTNRISQFHLGGFADKGSHLLDMHSEAICPAVWQLYSIALNKFGSIPSSIEWDNNIPDFPTLHAEAIKAQKYYDHIT